jgi:NAD(P)-dependent dehydrogenase (short-subunit alcohol dehydrogenase family)
MAFLELLVEGNKRREGSGKPTSQIISIGSVGGLTRFTDSFIYNASKAAVHHLTKNLGAHFVPFDVRCNVIAPGCKSSSSPFPYKPLLSSRHAFSLTCSFH